MDEQIFHEKLKKIRWSTNREDLAQATRTTLQLLLRRPGDQKLLSGLLSQLDGIIRSLPAGGGDTQSAQIRQAAVRCVVLLQSAKKGRLTRAQQKEKDDRWRHRRIPILVATAVGVAAFYLVLMPHRNFMPQAKSVGAAIQDALSHNRLGLTRHDNITVRATHEHTIVTAERLTPEDCISAAKEIQKMGDLTINDTDVGKPNETKFNTLCRKLGDATLTITVNHYRE